MKQEFPRLHLLALAGLLLAGCVNLKPVVQDVRYFVLTPSAVADAPVFHVGQPVGIAAISVPGYMLQNRLVIHRSNNEIRYAENLQWAERLDKNIQRVLAANLGSLLGSTNMYLSVWRREEVNAEVYVSFSRFDLDDDGKVMLEARWFITTPGAETTKRSGVSKISRQGPSVSGNPDDAVASLSAALGQLSGEIAAAFSDEKRGVEKQR